MADGNSDDPHDSDLSTQRGEITYVLDDDERPSEAVVRAVASLTNTAVLDLDPLYEVIDPDDLDGLFDTPDDDAAVDGTPDDDAVAERSTTFTFAGCRVTVTPDEVHVRERDGE